MGAAFALPAAVVIPINASAGLALALGVMPAAVFNLPHRRRGRRAILFVGALSGLSLAIGSVLTQLPALAVVAIFSLAVACALWSGTSRFGALAMAVCLPIVGIGLSFGSVQSGLLLGGCMVAGSVYAWLVSLVLPESPDIAAPPAGRMPRKRLLIYGILLGLAGATAATIGYVLDLEHVGWATGAALLVMRPARAMLFLRSIGRAASVLIGAFAAAAFALLSAPSAVTAVVVVAVLAALAATQGSRWYIAPGFTSFLALTLILQGSAGTPVDRFNERVLETLLGVGIALIFGAAVPAALRFVSERR